MKISKRSIQACDESCSKDLTMCEDMPCEVTLDQVALDPFAVAHQSAVTSILSAIESLGAVAKEDPIARESIANLSVVLFDLKD